VKEVRETHPYGRVGWQTVAVLALRLRSWPWVLGLGSWVLGLGSWVLGLGRGLGRSPGPQKRLHIVLHRITASPELTCIVRVTRIKSRQLVSERCLGSRETINREFYT
jgi:hypothetical protein